MLNTPIDLSQYEDITIESDIKTVKDLLDELENGQSPHLYKITEYFSPEDKEESKHYSHTKYEILNLTMEIEDKVAYCDGYIDSEDQMLLGKMEYGLSAFCIDDIIMISIHNKSVTISLDYGYIQIHY